MNNLIFFNKEGYPHNFQYNTNTEVWEGKILFDENSDQTFKTQSLHIFEDVPSIDFASNVDLIDMNYNNDSGLTIAGQTNFNNEVISNIIKANESQDFYSKWIYGSDFNKKFPLGTIIYFSGVTGSTYTSSLSDFSDDQYFTVLSVKKNAILIITNTSNDIFDLTFVSGYVGSMNMISINNYNRNLSEQTLFQNLYKDKKISIINSDSNDMIVSVKTSGVTVSYLNEIRLNGLSNQIFTLQVQLFTERPKILQGEVSLTDNQYLTIGKFSYLLAPETIYTSSGPSLNKKEIIFEDSLGNKLYSGVTFVVDELVDKINLGYKNLTFKQYSQDSSNTYQYNNTTQWNTIQYNGFLDIKSGDIISLLSLTGSTSKIHNNRDFSISNVSYNNSTNITVLFTPGYIFDEVGVTYNITKTLQTRQVKTIKVTPSGDVSDFNNIVISDATCYLTSSILNFSQVYISGTTTTSEFNTIQAFINKYKATLYQYGVDAYYSQKNNIDYLSIESLYGSKTGYFYASGYTNNIKIADDFSLSNPQIEIITLTGSIGSIIVTETAGLSNLLTFAFDLAATTNTFVTDYASNYLAYNINVTSDNDKIIFTSNDPFTPPVVYNNTGDLNGDVIHNNAFFTEKYDIITNEKLTNEKTNKSSDGLYKNQVPTEILFDLHNDTDRFGFRLTLNGNQYSIDYSTDTLNTINKFIDTFSDIFYSNGFTINSGYSINYSGYTLNILSDVDIGDLEVIVNILSTYNIIQRGRNRSILLSGNEIRSNSTHFFDLELSTGMIVKLTGSSYNENNKEYNIISLTDNIIGLSYQGTFISENNINIFGKTREFIRKPRGEYYRDVYLRVYWEIPYDNVIDESIFLYDISGTQLVPYNNNPLLKYKGPTPLIDSVQNNIVMLNTDSNKDLSKVYNPRFQQTIFDELNFKLEQLDSSLSYNWIPEPLEIFIGYNSDIEGVNSRTLLIDVVEKSENNSNNFHFSGYTNSGSSITINNFVLNGITLEYKAPIDFNFITYGFKKDQIINIDFKDQNKYHQVIHENIYNCKILDVTRNKIIIDSGYTYLNNNNYTGSTIASTGFTYFSTTGVTFYFKIEVQPKQILYCPTYGQTEIEDIRYKVNLNNLGIQSEEDVYQILYASDIEDNAIDYTLFNRKRKEMLTTFREIYDYIGSYKSLVNAINYFGYNALQLYEYYRNIDQSSSLYDKLHKVLIPDIFDNSVQGWNEMDFIAGKYQNNNNDKQLIWKKTNLFNLAYRITDEDGNNVLIYSLDEVQYKLTKLKTWLRKNIIPISANLLDITGVADTSQTLYQDYDESNQTKKSVVERNSTVVNFNYTATLNFGSDYLITVNFYTIFDVTGSTIYTQDELGYISKFNPSGYTGSTMDTNEIPLSFSAKIKTFYLSGTTILNPTETLIPVQYFKIFKNDLTPFSFNINKYLDPYIYIETTTYDNSGNGLGYVNNKLFYYDEPRNYWLVNHNFDLSKMKYWQTTDYVTNTPQKWIGVDNIVDQSTIVSTSVETNVKVNTLNNTYLSQISTNSNS